MFLKCHDLQYIFLFSIHHKLNELSMNGFPNFMWKLLGANRWLRIALSLVSTYYMHRHCETIFAEHDERNENVPTIYFIHNKNVMKCVKKRERKLFLNFSWFIMNKLSLYCIVHLNERRFTDAMRTKAEDARRIRLMFWNILIAVRWMKYTYFFRNKKSIRLFKNIEGSHFSNQFMKLLKVFWGLRTPWLAAVV